SSRTLMRIGMPDAYHTAPARGSPRAALLLSSRPMTKMRCLATLALLFASAGLSLGCARGPDVASGLGLRRVVIYRNGVGYFEREGKVDEDEVTFKVRTERVGDFLATLAVIEQGDSSVKSASFPVDVKHDKDDDDADEGSGGDGNDPRFE